MSGVDKIAPIEKKFLDDDEFANHFDRTQLTQIESSVGYELYKGTDKTENGKDYCLKIIDNSKEDSYYASETFQTDLATIASVRHSNIIRYHEVYKLVKDKQEIIIKKELTVKNLDQELKERGKPYTGIESVMHLQNCVDVLEYLRDYHGISHCNLSPKNILLDQYQEWKFSEFGHNMQSKQEKLIENKKSQIASTQGEETSIYRSPDLHNAITALEKVVSIDGQKEDVWSLGVILLRLVSNCSEAELDQINVNPQKCQELINQHTDSKPFYKHLISGMCNFKQEERWDLQNLKANIIEHGVITSAKGKN